jgi:hypothetical protein
MEQKRSRFFSIMVVGDNPEEITKKYDLNAKVEPYIKYKYADASKYKSVSIKALEKILSEADKITLPSTTKAALKERLTELKKLSDFDYYRQLTNGLFYDSRGNALSEENPEGKWKTCRPGKHFSLPLILKDGSEVHSAKAGDVDWEKMHNTNQEIYKAAWEIVVEGRKPIGEEEETIAKAMGDKEAYFSKFKDKDAYVAYSTSYWNYAYVDKNGWKDVDMSGDETKWIKGFFDNFVKPLNPEDVVSIYECTVNEED